MAGLYATALKEALAFFGTPDPVYVLKLSGDGEYDLREKEYGDVFEAPLEYFELSDVLLIDFSHLECPHTQVLIDDLDDVERGGLSIWDVVEFYAPEH